MHIEWIKNTKYYLSSVEGYLSAIIWVCPQRCSVRNGNFLGSFLWNILMCLMLSFIYLEDFEYLLHNNYTIWHQVFILVGNIHITLYAKVSCCDRMDYIWCWKWWLKCAAKGVDIFREPYTHRKNTVSHNIEGTAVIAIFTHCCGHYRIYLSCISLFSKGAVIRIDN